MKKAFIFFFLSTVTAALYGQGNRQALLADSLYRYSSYVKAAKHYEKAIRKDESPELLIGLANSHYKLQEYDNAISTYAQAESSKNAWSVQDRLNYIDALRIMGDEDEVSRLLKLWDAIPGERENVYEESMLAMDIFFMDSSVYEVNELEINTDNSEFSPAYFKDGILFASSRPQGNVSSRKYHWNQENYLDLFYSENDEIKPFSVNTKLHDGPVAFFNDGKKVIFTRNEKVSKHKDQRQLALFEADVDNDGIWKNIRPLELNHPDYSISHPAVSADGSTLYFVSNMPGGIGGTDIYKSKRTAEGWGDPVNLGGDINTAGNEMFPVLYNDQIFFASDGHPGLGGLDLFVTERLGEGSFLVRNVGYPLNTTWDDFSLITKDGKTGFLSSNRKGNDDIYSFIKDKIIVDITYVDQDQNTLDSVATLFEGKTYLQGKDQVTRIHVDRESLHELEAMRRSFADTIFGIEAKDEFFISKTVELKPLEEANVMRGVVNLYPIAINDKDYDLFMGQEETLLRADEQDNWKNHFELGQAIDDLPEDKLIRTKRMLEKNGYTVRVHDRIERIHFDFDKWNIRASEHEKLKRVAELLNQYGQTQVIISAHTDERGSDAYNMDLSRKRAQSTVDYLNSQGVDAARMSTRAYGKSMLLITCDPCTEDQHERNRRVTFDVSLED